MAAAGFRIAALALLGAGCTSIAADARTFEGTRWQVTAINGHPTPRYPNFRIEFARGRFTARMGCNIAYGIYRIEHEQLIPGFGGHTEMACKAVSDFAVPPMTFETWGFAVLHKPMRMSWKSSRELTLTNGAGSIQLEFAG